MNNIWDDNFFCSREAIQRTFFINSYSKYILKMYENAFMTESFVGFIPYNSTKKLLQQLLLMCIS